MELCQARWPDLGQEAGGPGVTAGRGGRGRLHGALQADPGPGRACPQPFCLLPGFPRHPASRQHVCVLEPWPLNCGDVGPPCTLHGEDVPHADPH